MEQRAHSVSSAWTATKRTICLHENKPFDSMKTENTNGYPHSRAFDEESIAVSEWPGAIAVQREL